MRILFINTFDVKGGAAIIASRLMKGLAQYHHTENFYLVRFKKGQDPRTEVTISSLFEKLVERSLNQLTDLMGLQYLYYPFSSSKILSHAREIRPDIISLHNTHGGYFATPLLSRLSEIAPVVWTLHDMWSFTGNAAHTFGNTSWKEMKNERHLRRIEPAIGINTGRHLLHLKKKVYGRSNITLVSPSRWLADLAGQSPVFEGKDIRQIYNGVDNNIYRKNDQAACRKKLGLPLERKTIMFSAENLSLKNPWKGGQHLLQILAAINERSSEKINLLVLGSGQTEEMNKFARFEVFHKGYISDETTMSDALNAADVFIYPTRADNLPNVLVEAIACGTPCVSFNIGGNPEIISDGRNGYIIEPFDFDEFARKTIDLLDNEQKREAFSAACIAEARNKFSLKDMADHYYELFLTIKPVQDAKGN
jgi:glycosyltransferase involved in cell wall biosynthesis